MKKQTSLIGTTIIFFVMALKLFNLTIEAAEFNYFLLTVFLVIDAFLIISFIFIYQKIITSTNEKSKYIDFLYDFIAIFVGALIVYFFSNYFSFNSVLVVGVVSLLAGIIIKKQAPEITLGAFIGTGAFLNSTYLGVFIASFIATFVYFLLKGVFEGLGGKLGTTAFAGGIATFFLFSEVIKKTIPYSGINIFFVIMIALVSGVLTFILNNELKLGPITAYGVVVLLGSVFLLFSYTKDYNFLAIVYGSALVGMTNKKEMKDYFIVSLASFIFGLFAFVGQSFANIGGRVGLLALISVLTATGIYFGFLKLLKRPEKQL